MKMRKIIIDRATMSIEIPHATDTSQLRQLSDINTTTSIPDAGTDAFHWTALTIVQALAIFVLAGIAEIGGGWLVWQTVRGNKPWWWALLCSIVLVVYGFIPTLQPTEDFGRVYAIYGGFFIVLSFAWSWKFDGMVLDIGDLVGGSLALASVMIILFWPR